ncbi:hypothetical protein EAT49_15965 [Histidinibacterium lentulum]|uniref:Sulfotransferase n=2 Tax=Histidinibacterium lentulum TaxID=2480588 RepID=A0A3N2QVE4_9RHOB|nr:hypothetical protein EAT49_15965 [Histidinibacterium lentulum]
MDEAAARFDAFQDSPWCRYYQRYAKMHPDAQFILTLRPLEKWMNSMSNFGSTDVPIWQHVYGKRTFRGNEDHFKSLYNSHTKEAIEYFSGSPGRLLILDIEADPKVSARAVEAFLGLRPTDLSFPKVNVSRRSGVKWLLRGWF